MHHKTQQLISFCIENYPDALPRLHLNRITILLISSSIVCIVVACRRLDICVGISRGLSLPQRRLATVRNECECENHYQTTKYPHQCVLQHNHSRCRRCRHPIYSFVLSNAFHVLFCSWQIGSGLENHSSATYTAAVAVDQPTNITHNRTINEPIAVV